MKTSDLKIGDMVEVLREDLDKSFMGYVAYIGREGIYITTYKHTPWQQGIGCDYNLSQIRVLIPVGEMTELTK